MVRLVSKLCVLVGLVSTTARADELGVARTIADDAAFTPGLLRAHAEETSFFTAATTWSGASGRVQLDALGEVHVYGPVRLVVRVADAFRDSAKPGLGAGIEVLDEARHGVAGTAYLQYKTEGFSEPEGELEAVFAVGKQLGAVRAVADIGYGQDPEGAERDGEFVLAAHVEPTDGMFTGGMVRYRDALGSTEAIVRDGFSGATATFAIDRFAVTAMAGVAMIETRSTGRDFGAAATVAIGAGF